MAGVRVLVTPRAFLDLEGEHLTILKQAGYEIIANPRPRTLTEDEMAAYIVGMDGIIVGDDPVTHRVLDRATASKSSPNSAPTWTTSTWTWPPRDTFP